MLYLKQPRPSALISWREPNMENQEYAGFWIRFAASLIDSLIFAIVIFPLLYIVYGAAYWNAEQGVSGFWDILLQYVFPLAVTVWFWVKYMGTPGKMALRLRVVDADTGQAISTGKALLRYIGYYLSALPLFLGFVWVGIDKRKQGFHDKLAGTVVVRELSKEQGESGHRE